jgi:hypothetical protein
LSTTAPDGPTTAGEVARATTHLKHLLTRTKSEPKKSRVSVVHEEARRTALIQEADEPLGIGAIVNIAEAGAWCGHGRLHCVADGAPVARARD